MAGGSSGYQVALVRRQLTQGLISTLPETAGLSPLTSFSTSYPELDIPVVLSRSPFAILDLRASRVIRK